LNRTTATTTGATEAVTAVDATATVETKVKVK
jgi:hypothetical protein